MSMIDGLIERPAISDGVRLSLLDMAAGHMERFRPDEIIERYGSPFFERWYLCRKSEGEVENRYLHRFLRSDFEDPHDHPWSNESVVLAGSYTECWQRSPSDPIGYGTRKPGQVVARNAELIHCITQVEPGTITLFVTGRKSRGWGFWTKNGFVHHESYSGQPEAQVAA
jgi:hypothetical protein